MCGICGILSIAGEDRLISGITKMNSLLRHRGPDDEGYLVADAYSNMSLSGDDTPVSVLKSKLPYAPVKSLAEHSSQPFLALGHRRLSIIDITPSGHQPMCSFDQNFWIVFNGEIYNYIELRDELKASGARFVSESDTEVVIHAYQKWGQDCVNHFNGMWAFVIYDKIRGILFGSRDRLGVKPLYYYRDSKYFLFASEQKALASIPMVKTGINDRAVFDYLVLSHVQPEPEGFFKNIFELEAGCNFQIGLKDLNWKIYRYYQITIDVQSKYQSTDQVAEELLERINQAVTLRTRADVEVGACLSGGLDSSFIVKLLDQNHVAGDSRFLTKVFTAVYPGFEFDEEKWAQKIVDSSNVSWYKTLPEAPDLLDDIDDVVYAADFPMLTTSTYAQYRVMKLAQENGIKVLLDGQGADELFGGYTHFKSVYWNELLREVKFLTLNRELKANSGYFANLKRWMTDDVRALAQNLPFGLSSYLYNQAVFELRYVNSDLKNQYKNRYGEIRFPFGSDLNRTLAGYCQGEELQTILRLEDRMSMHFSIESRTPFADDPELISMAFSIPSRLKINRGVHKFIMRKAGESILPLEIANRKDKIGFQTPEASWLKSLNLQLPDLICDNIEEFVNVKQLKIDMNRLIDSPTSEMSSRLLRFILLSKWRSVYQI